MQRNNRIDLLPPIIAENSQLEKSMSRRRILLTKNKTDSDASLGTYVLWSGKKRSGRTVKGILGTYYTRADEPPEREAGLCSDVISST